MDGLHALLQNSSASILGNGRIRKLVFHIHPEHLLDDNAELDTKALEKNKSKQERNEWPDEKVKANGD